MSTSDYEIHLGRERYDSLWGQGDDESGLPFGEDNEDIDKLIAEELGRTRPRRRKGKAPQR